MALKRERELDTFNIIIVELFKSNARVYVQRGVIVHSAIFNVMFNLISSGFNFFVNITEDDDIKDRNV